MQIMILIEEEEEVIINLVTLQMNISTTYPQMIPNRIIMIIAKEVEILNFLFWNLKGENLVTKLAKLVMQHETDIIAVVESEKLDREHFINLLRRENIYYTDILSNEGNEAIHLICKKGIDVSIYKENKRYKFIHEQG